MWLIVGCLSLVVFSTIMIYHRYSAEWVGAEGNYNNIQYQYRNYNDRRGRRIKVGFATSKRYDFVIRRYNSLDRFFELIGFHSGKHICHTSFDRSLLIISDDCSVSQILATTSELTDSILKLFELGNSSTANIEKLICRRGRLWAVLDDHSADTALMEKFADIALPTMQLLSEELSSFEGPVKGHRTDRFSVHAVAALLMAGGFMFQGALDWMQGSIGSVTWHMLLEALVFGAVISGVLAMVFTRFLRNNMKQHKFFAELFFIGMLGVFSSIYAVSVPDNQAEQIAGESAGNIKLAISYN